MTQVPAYHRSDDPAVAAARARERMRALSRRAFEGEKHRRALPVFSLTGLLLAGLLVYFNLTRLEPPAPVPAHHHAAAHPKK